ncbi:hypothetical protein [Mycobacterium shigaense]|uniref:Uncharacterized protein n=1 Tax=Mycobacterium shigaense TaxID=722731 RepID=A0A1Z4EMY0_9MYCO|nr:hypothetical protein [Mycobacterium shigaense]MEA1120642.1 hypothetical protein [Mycobacterium shigaense]BAX94281.1 hypothetical protein MSG_04160 [Mycobacterium shigaense]
MRPRNSSKELGITTRSYPLVGWSNLASAASKSALAKHLAEQISCDREDIGMGHSASKSSEVVVDAWVMTAPEIVNR